MIAEDLSECDRIKLLLNKRDPNQYGYVFLNAVSIFRDDIEMQSEIIPILVEKIREYSEDQQIIAGDAFSELIEGNVSANCPSLNTMFHLNGLAFDVIDPTGTCFRTHYLYQIVHTSLITVFGQILDDQFAEQVFTLAEEMLNQWSRQILEAWICIFAKLLPVLAKRDNGARQQVFVQKGVATV